MVLKTTVNALQYYSGDDSGNPNLAGSARQQKQLKLYYRFGCKLKTDPSTGQSNRDYCQGFVNDAIAILDDNSTKSLKSKDRGFL